MTYNEKLDHCLKLAIEGKSSESEVLLKSLHSEQPEDPRVIFNLGWHDFRHGDLKSGFEKMVYGRHLNVFGSKPPLTNKPIWRGESLDNKIILFNGEGGYGDQIINIRFAKYFHDKGAKVVVSCSKELFSLFRGIAWIHQLVEMNSAFGVDCDYWVPSMHAAFILDLNYDDLWNGSYITNIKRRNLQTDKVKIGLRWAGNPKFEHEQHRKFDPNYLLSLSNIPNTQFYSLQKDDSLVSLPDHIIDLQNDLTNWVDTAEIISDLDLVISSCTSVAHLSASIGKTTWIALPILPYYVWAEPGNKSKWYGDNVTLYRQEEYGTWDQPFKKMQQDLYLFCESKFSILNIK